MRWLVPLLVLGLAGCYSPRSVGHADDVAGAWGQRTAGPLEASLWIDPFTAAASFDLSRPAHVGIFHWQPGRSFTMVYPASGYSHRQDFTAGRHHLWTLARNYAPPRGRAGFASHPGTFSQPSYFVLVASERPLQLSPFFLYGTGQSVWVNRVSWSYNPYTATELLASQIVPSPETTDWTVAYQVVWFHDRFDGVPRAADVRWVRCPDGTVIAVPLDILAARLLSCPDGTLAEPPPGDTASSGARSVIAGLVQERRLAAGALGGERSSPEEVRSLVHRIREARIEEGETVGELSLPRLGLRDARRAQAPAATGTEERPAIRPAAVERGEALRAGAAGDRARPGTAAGSARPADERGPRADPRPARGERTRPATDRRRPQSDPPAATPARQPRPSPEARPAPPQGQRPAQPPPPPDDSRD
jgi:hypothetical protein